jgi:chemotaxis protein CheD
LSLAAPAPQPEAAQPFIHNVILGKFRISSDPNEAITTVLGSCVAVCLFDLERGIGGMNHFLLPEGRSGDLEEVVFGLQAMELLINAMLKQGAQKNNMKAKLFGGAQMIGGLSNIGEGNVAFAREFLKDENFPVVSESVGGTMGRKIMFVPTTGKVKQRLVPAV